MSWVLALVAAGSFAALAMAVIGYSWLTGISRNPEASKEMFTPGIIALALAEFVALLSFVIALIK